MNIDPEYLVIDLFSGAGGVSQGARDAKWNGRNVVYVIVAVNHDNMAIEAHKANHPETVHFIEDIRLLSMTKLKSVVDRFRSMYPNAKLIIWASLECTNFSKAKGGLPREADSRTLGNDLPRYIKALNPNGVFIENVEEFMSWGPLDDNGKPISKHAGEDYLKWINSITNLGYNYEYRLLNAANFGAYQTRLRYFAQFMHPDMVISWPQPTHAKKPQEGMFGKLEKWKAVKDVLNLNEYGTSIFDRKKPLVDNTLQRILAGLKKFGPNGQNQFIQKHYSGKPEGKLSDINNPAGSITTAANQSLVSFDFLMKYNSSSKNGSKEHSVKSLNDPASTISTRNNELNLCHAFVIQYFGKGYAKSIDDPAGSITTKDRNAIVTPFIMRDFTTGINWTSIEAPAGTITPNPKMNLVYPFIINQNFYNGPQSVENPIGTVLAGRKHQYLVNPQYSSKGGCIYSPSPTIIARQDKMPLSLATCFENIISPRWDIEEGDTDVMIELKTYMREHGVADIYMRMLFISELLRIQGLGDQYKLVGPQTVQKKHIGNAVEKNMAQKIFEASVAANIDRVNKYKTA